MARNKNQVRRARQVDEVSVSSVEDLPTEEGLLFADLEKPMSSSLLAAADPHGAASLPHILAMLAESITKLVGPEDAPAPPGAASHLHILRKFAHSISEIARPQEPLLTSTAGPASNLQILRKFAESIANIATQEEPKQILPTPAFPRSPIVSPEEIEEIEQRKLTRRQAQLEFLQYEKDLVEERKAKQIFPESPVVPNLPCPKPEVFLFPPSTSQTTPQTEDDIPDEVIIAFVKKMEKAHQYFKFMDYLRAQRVIEIKHNSNPAFILCKLRKFQTLEMKEFNLLNLSKICLFIKAYIFELKGKDCILKGSKAQMPAKDAYAHSSPVLYLLSQARQKSYVLDENPRVELKNLKMRTPLFYHDSLVSRKLTVEREARTVVVSNISNDAFETDIWDFFYTCGSIEDLKCHRSFPGQGQIAHITFKTVTAAEYALRFTYTLIPHKIRHEKLPLVIEPEAVEDASGSECAVKKPVDVKSMLAEALNKYRELWTFYSQSQSKDGKACKNEMLDQTNEEGECRDACEWMRMEALANGGYTFGGQYLLSPPSEGALPDSDFLL